MDLLDVNVLVYAQRRDMQQHADIAPWLVDLATSDRAFALSDEIAAALVRIVTNQRIFKPATTVADALAFLDELRRRPHCRILHGGRRRWDIYADLLHRTGATGNLAADAWHASLAIEHGCTFVSCDADFARFPGLRWRHPLSAAA
jgi:toxin-antitoxin system PIN domain toxin